MINIRSIRKLTNNDGLTLKHGKIITYKTGWQVATEGIETRSAREAINAVKAYNDDCGIWYSEGIYYVDKSMRVNILNVKPLRLAASVIKLVFSVGAQWG